MTALDKNCKANINEEDGSVFTEENGIRKTIRAGELVRRCGAMETSACYASVYKLSNTVMPIWLQSKHKLVIENIHKALKIVTRQVPQLQFCISKHKGKFWFKRMTKLDIDFETTTKDEMEVLHETLDTSFDIWNGPLWKVKFIEHKSKSENGNHSSVLFLIIQHSINDGITNMKIARDFVSVMNKMNAGEISVPVFSPIIPTIDDYARNKTNIPEMVKKVCSKGFSTLFNNLNDKVYFSGRLPYPQTKDAKTKVLIDQFSENETEQIVRICKEENISIHSFISNVANFALLAIAQSKSVTPLDTKKILVVHSVNLRRHFEPMYKDAPGFHVSVMEDKMIASLSDVDDFWTVCRTNQSNFKHRIDVKKEHLKSIPIWKYADLSIPINCYLSRHGYKCKPMVFYLLSNMGNLDNLLPTSPDDNVQITNLNRSVSAQYLGSPFSLYFHTLRGILSLSMDYYTNFTTDEIALEFFNKFYKLSRNLIKYNRLLINNNV